MCAGAPQKSFQRRYLWTDQNLGGDAARVHTLLQKKQEQVPTWVRGLGSVPRGDHARLSAQLS